MKTYLVLAFSAPGEEPKSAGDMDQWKSWFKEMGDKVVDMGSPLAMGVEGSGKGGFNKIKEDQWPAQGYMMINADNIEQAQEYMKSSPLGGDMPLRIFEKTTIHETS